MQAAIVLKGDDQAAANETFSFRVQGNAMTTLPESIGLNVYVTAHPDDGGVDAVKQFAVARVSRDSTQFLGLTPQEVTFNSAKNVANPLYDRGVAFFSLFNGQESILSGANERPVVVLNSDLGTIYMINNFTPTAKNINVLSVHNFNVPLNALTNM